MPRRFQEKKDAISCEKSRGVAKKRRSVNVRMGQPGVRNDVILKKSTTRRTETSK